MLRKPAYDWPMITAEELRDARLRAGFTSQSDLAEALGVSLRTVTAWEAEGGHVSPRGEAKVRALLWPAPGPLSSYSNYELLSELGRRLDGLHRVGNDPVSDQQTVVDGRNGDGTNSASVASGTPDTAVGSPRKRGRGAT